MGALLVSNRSSRGVECCVATYLVPRRYALRDIIATNDSAAHLCKKRMTNGRFLGFTA